MGDFIRTWVSGGGIPVILVLMAINACGIPIPSEVVMPVAGIFAAAGHLNVVGVVIAGAAGNLVGSLIAYALSRRFGRPLLLGPGRRVGISASHLDLADHWFARFGYPAVFFGRFLPVVTTYISFPAGLAKVHPAPFVVLTFAGALVWCSALTALGYGVGANYTRVSGPISKVAIGIAVLVVLGLAAWYLRGRRRRGASTD